MSERKIFDFVQGDSPLLVSMPHVGTSVPSAMSERMTAQARSFPDTDWHVHQLYDFLEELGVSTLKANYSRYVVDLNRAPGGESLYPGQSVTEVCPTTLFNDQPIYNHGSEPDKAEISARIDTYWQPYHNCIDIELKRIRDKFGYAVLLDAHSIKSRVPRFFEGQLPDFNWGTADGSSCDPLLGERLLAESTAVFPYTPILNGRFKGGFITRNNGRPNESIHAVQLELSQATYMDDEDSFEISPAKADLLRSTLKGLVTVLLNHFDKK
jgi:N-formylglutamate deformylase|tara:strand:- start:1614 stop:2417 length:804 start_codon:yes stop_codon:yes gene_type:complete